VSKARNPLLNADDWLSFLGLSERVGVVESQTGNDAPPSAEASYRSVDDAMRARLAHPVGKWLFANRDFTSAWVLFQRKFRKRVSAGPVSEPTADLVFVRIVADWAGLGMGALARGYRPRPNSTRHRLSARKQARRLLKSLSAAPCIEDPNAQMRHLHELRELVSELSRPVSKLYSRKNALGSAAVKGLAQSLLRELGLRSPRILEHLSSMIGAHRDLRACGRYFDAAVYVRLIPAQLD